jgi:hypothetical protein
MNSRACSLAEATRKVAASRSANTRSALDAMIDAIDLGLFLSELQLWKASCDCELMSVMCMRAQRIYRRARARCGGQLPIDRGRGPWPGRLASDRDRLVGMQCSRVGLGPMHAGAGCSYT